VSAPPDQPGVVHTVEAGICTVTLSRPEAANALRPEDRNAFLAILAEADLSADVRVVHLRAEGKVFCAGADVGGIARQSVDRHTGDTMRILLRGAQQLIAAVLDCSKPVVAEVQGTAAGMGAHLAYASDMVIASDKAKFVESFVLRGLTVDAGGAYLLPRRIGLQKAKELVFLGDALPVAEAHALGLVNQVVAPEELAATARALVERLAAAPTSAIMLSKKLLNASLDQDRNTAFLTEAMAQEIQGTASDSTEGVAAFMERRAPDFKGW
jgi:2-(1,2-epoxy-1,2-dihydrophenyl)acetyl-CoA isomerase